MLFESARHEPLLDAKWDAAQAEGAIRAIVVDLEEALGSDIVWPVHPLDAMKTDRGTNALPVQQARSGRCGTCTGSRRSNYASASGSDRAFT